jgi:hypothetical protein
MENLCTSFLKMTEKIKDKKQLSYLTFLTGTTNYDDVEDSSLVGC